MNTADRKKRRQYFISKGFQTKFILKFCLVVIMSSLMIGGLIFFLSRNSTTVAIDNTKVIVKSTADFILPVIIQTLLMVTIFSGIAVWIITLFISHKIAGPLYRLKREIDILKEGDLTRNFKIRAKDQIQDLARSLNLMCASLRLKHTELRNKYHRLKGYLEAKDFRVLPEQKEEFFKLEQDIDDILNYFKV